MKEITGAEVSLSVAMIMYPEYEWKVPYKGGDCIVSGRASGGLKCKSFDYQAEACAWDMAVFLATEYETPDANVQSMLEELYPQLAIAKEIIMLDKSKDLV